MKTMTMEKVWLLLSIWFFQMHKVSVYKIIYLSPTNGKSKCKFEYLKFAILIQQTTDKSEWVKICDSWQWIEDVCAFLLIVQFISILVCGLLLIKFLWILHQKPNKWNQFCVADVVMQRSSGKRKLVTEN